MSELKLFTPYTFAKSGKLSKNRIALAPMTNTQSHDDGCLSDDEYNFLTRRAKEGFGIITTCASHVSADGQGWRGELGIFDDKHIEGLTRLANGIHKYGSLGIVQIFHGGAMSPESLTGKQPWSASAHTMTLPKGNIEVREATEEDIEKATEAFVSAARRAYEAGFDGVELHGAHGYLLHQFISKFTNQRSDQWGGSFENRIRLVRTILKKIKSLLPSSFMAGVRLSPEDKLSFKGINFDESIELAGILADDGADFIHVSPWDVFKKPDKYKDGEKVIIEYFREKVPAEVPVMTAGKIWSRADADKILSLGSDFAVIGRAAIGIPDWANKAEDKNFIPQMPPYTINQLRDADLGDAFIKYMGGWKGFVAEK